MRKLSRRDRILRRKLVFMDQILTPYVAGLPPSSRAMSSPVREAVAGPWGQGNISALWVHVGPGISLALSPLFQWVGVEGSMAGGSMPYPSLSALLFLFLARSISKLLTLCLFFQTECLLLPFCETLFTPVLFLCHNMTQDPMRKTLSYNVNRVNIIKMGVQREMASWGFSL